MSFIQKSFRIKTPFDIHKHKCHNCSCFKSCSPDELWYDKSCCEVFIPTTDEVDKYHNNWFKQRDFLKNVSI